LGISCFFPVAVYIEQLDLAISRIQFCIFAAIVNIFFACANPFEKYNLTYAQTLVMQLLPLEIVIGLVFFQHYFTVTLLLIAGSVFAVFVFRWIVRASFKAELEECDDGFKRRIERNVRKISGLFIAAVFSVVLVGGWPHFIQGNYIATPSVEASSSVEPTDGSLVKTFMPELAKLEEEAWGALDITEKIDILQILLNIETTYLVIEPMAITCEKINSEIAGEYSYIHKKMYIDVDCFDDPDLCIETICHEARHAYQHHVVNSLDWSDKEVQTGYFYRDARKWRDNFKNYISATVDEEGYYSQSIERDAREYATKALNDYKYYVNSYYGESSDA